MMYTMTDVLLKVHAKMHIARRVPSFSPTTHNVQKCTLDDNIIHFCTLCHVQAQVSLYYAFKIKYLYRYKRWHVFCPLKIELDLAVLF